VSIDPALSNNAPQRALPPIFLIAIYVLCLGGGLLAVTVLRAQGTSLGMLFAAVMGVWLVLRVATRIPGFPPHIARSWAVGIAIGSAMMLME
jgi:hypothetical protein